MHTILLVLKISHNLTTNYVQYIFNINDGSFLQIWSADEVGSRKGPSLTAGRRHSANQSHMTIWSVTFGSPRWWNSILGENPNLKTLAESQQSTCDSGESDGTIFFEP